MQRHTRHGWLAPAAALLGAIAIFPGSAVAAATAPPIPHAQHPHSPPGGHRVIHARPRTSAPKAIRASASFTSVSHGSVSLRALARQAHQARQSQTGRSRFRAAATPHPRVAPDAARTTFATVTLDQPGVSQNSGPSFLAADATAATNGSQILQSTGAFLQVYDNSGATLCGGGVTLQHFLRAGADSPSEPRVQYDPANGRFSLIADIVNQPGGAQPAMYLATSDTSDPCGTWFAYRLTFTGGPFSPGNILDFPTFGQDSRALLVGLSEGSPNDSGPSNFSVFAVPKSAAYSHTTLSFPVFTPGAGANIAPASSTGNPLIDTPSSYFVSTTPGQYTLYRMDNSGTANPSVTQQASFSAAYQVPARAPQPGTSDTLDALDGRIQSAPVWDGSRVWFTNVVSAPSGPPTEVRYGFIVPGSNTLQFATVRHDSTSADFNPAIGVGLAPNGIETVFLNWVFTDTAFNLPATDTVTSMVYDGGTLPNLQGTDVELASGSVTHTDGLRFGEFTSVAIDPAVSDSTCAVTTNQSFLAPNGVWQTDLARLCSPSQVRVPSVAGDTVGTARTALANASLRGDNLLSSTACTAASQGLVLSTDPPAGNTAEIGTEVTLTVCNLLTAVPNLTGLDQGTAESRITGAGLAIGNENPDFRCLERQGIVVSQTPAPGSSVMRGTPVNINVSTGTKANGNPCIFK